jgi:hypothetical protein
MALKSALLAGGLILATICTAACQKRIGSFIGIIIDNSWRAMVYNQSFKTAHAVESKSNLTMDK